VNAVVQPFPNSPPPPPEALAIVDTPEGAQLLRWLEIRQKAVEASLDAGERRFEAIEEELRALQKNLAANTEATERIERAQDRLGNAVMENIRATKKLDANTSEMVDAFASLKGGFKVLETLGRVAKPVAALLGLPAAAWALWKTFKGG
jgi:exonuclease VII large subunit